MIGYIAFWLLTVSVIFQEACGSGDILPNNTLLRISGSSTVYPVALGWKDISPDAYNYSITSISSTSGARSVCSPAGSQGYAEIGCMSRNWRNKEALLLDDDETFECYENGKLSGRRITQLQVGIDGIVITVAKSGAAHSCLTSPAVGGLTMAQLRWIFSSWTNDQLAEDGVDIESIIPGDDGDGIKEWSDIHAGCEETAIHPYGPGPTSGTYSFFSGRLFGDDDYNFCNATEVAKLDGLPQEEVNDIILNQRQTLGGAECYLMADVYKTTRQRLIRDGAGISFFVFSEYTKHSSALTAARIAADHVYGIGETVQAVVSPDTYSIVDGSYSIFTRPLYMNVANTAWDLVRDYVLNGFSDDGFRVVEQVGMVTVNAAVRARMVAIIRRGENIWADYIPVPPSSCPIGSGLLVEEYRNPVGLVKLNYTCVACGLGMYKRTDAPEACHACIVGTFAEEAGSSACTPCPVGTYANSTSANSCIMCEAGSFSQTRGATACMACSPGYAQAKKGQAFCEPCAAGRYQPDGAQEECEDCSPGSYAVAAAQLHCVACPQGHYMSEPAANQTCPRCPFGTYGPGEGLTECLACGNGLITQFPGADIREECVCPAGTFMSQGKDVRSDLPCQTCPAGMSCPIGSAYKYFPTQEAFQCPSSELQCNFPVVDAGHMTVLDNPLKVYRCLEEDACPGGAPGACANLRSPHRVACGECIDDPQTYLSGSRCKRCGGQADVLPILAAFILFILTAAAAVLAINKDVVKQSSASVSLATIGGVTITGMQAIGVFNNLSLSWFEPMQSIIESMNFLSFDMSNLKFACSVGNSPINGYIGRQLLAPSAIPIAWVVLMLKRWFTRTSVKVRLELVNAIGALYSIFFISVCVSAMSPFICYDHPGTNGASMVSMQSVLCFETGDWPAIVCVGCLSTVIVIIPFLSICAYGILQYPSMAQPQKRSLRKCFRFLFARFKHERYYYGGLLLIRNTAIPCIPILSDMAMQVLLMCSVLLLFQVISSSLHPWRTAMINFYDVSFSALLVLVLIAGIARSNFAASEDAMVVLGGSIFAAILLLVVAGIGKGLKDRFWPSRAYDAFLCHHKATTAAQARYLKIVFVQAQARARIFIDSDDLKQLDDLFEIVRMQVRKVFVMLTDKTLHRPWCCGEIVTAHKNGIKSVVIRAHHFQRPDLTECVEACFAETLLVNFSIMPSDASDAYRWLLDGAVPQIDMSKFRKGTQNVVGVVLELQGRPQQQSNPGEQLQLERKEQYHVISSDPEDDESSASAGILRVKLDRLMVLPNDGVVCLADWPPVPSQSLSNFLQNAESTVIILTVDSMQSTEQLRVMVRVAARGSVCVPMATPLFNFPTPYYFESVLPTLIGNEGDLYGLSEGRGTEEVIQLLKVFFRTVALDLSTHSGENILDAQCLAAGDRMGGSKASQGMKWSSHKVSSARSYTSSTGFGKANSTGKQSKCANNSVHAGQRIIENWCEEI